MTGSAFRRIGKLSFPWERLSLLGAILAMMTFLSCTLTPGNEIFRWVGGRGGSGMCRRDVCPLLLGEIIKTTSAGVNQSTSLHPACSTSARRSPRSSAATLLRARSQCPCARFVVFQCVRTLVGGARTRLLITRTKAARGNLRLLNKGRVFSSHPVSLCLSAGRGAGFFIR